MPLKTNFSFQKSRVFFQIWGILFVAAFLIRLPIFLSNNFNFDGDEAVIGIMAQQLLNGTHFPIYFFGQHYGFSTFEVISTAIFELFLGPSVWSLRLGGLLLFSFGLAFVYFALKRQQVSAFYRWLLLLLLLTFPTWMHWGMRMRGGYLTAFTFTCLLYYQFTKMEKNHLSWLMIGVVAGIIFESHTFILIGIFPIFCYWFFCHKFSYKSLIYGVLGVFSMIALIHFMGSFSAGVWGGPKPDFGWTQQLERLQHSLSLLVEGFGDFFYYEIAIPIPKWWYWLLVVFLVLSVFYVGFRLFRAKGKQALALALTLGIIAIYCFLVSIIRTTSPRYWLGLFTGFEFGLLYLLAKHWNEKLTRFFLGAFTFISVLGISVGSYFRTTWYFRDVNELQAFSEFHQAVEKTGAKAIFITDGLLQWKWNYLYGEEIPASCFYKRERIGSYQQRVWRIYQKTPKKVIIGGLDGMFFNMDTLPGFNDTRYAVGKKYAINTDADSRYIDFAMEK